MRWLSLELSIPRNVERVRSSIGVLRGRSLLSSLSCRAASESMCRSWDSLLTFPALVRKRGILRSPPLCPLNSPSCCPSSLDSICIDRRKTERLLLGLLPFSARLSGCDAPWPMTSTSEGYDSDCSIHQAHLLKKYTQSTPLQCHKE